MALFLKQYYNEATVAANDIGAISYLTDIRTLDLWGLSTVEAAQHKRNRSYNKATVYELTKSKGAKIAIVYDRLFTDGNIAYDGIPEQWIKVGQWRIENNVVCGDDTVSFFALDPSLEGSLIANLKQFSPRLPKTVKQSGEYIEGR